MEEAVEAGMAAMSEKYKEMGNNLYLKDMENVVNPLADLTAWAKRSLFECWWCLFVEEDLSMMMPTDSGCEWTIVWLKRRSSLFLREKNNQI